MLLVAVLCASTVWMVRPLLQSPLLATTRVESRPGFPSFSGNFGPRQVSYSQRSILLDGEPSFFLSGSIHGPRGTPETWRQALDLAVEQGLNMMTIYVFWNVVEPSRNASTTAALDSLGQLVEDCASRGLFVTLRFGPYVCAEWDYGGIPAWVGLEDGMVFRSYNEPWMREMKRFTHTVATYVKSRGLFAGQGGPIIMAQIENELEMSTDPAYVDFCGNLAAELDDSVVWLMCNGASANNTINTCNGYGEDCIGFIEKHGQSGRILIDQPALWTENEGGFQLWGDSPHDPTDYFWGRTASSVAYDTLRWIARGGSHVNYYMWWGGSNPSHYAAAGISNAYAYDVILCPNGVKHQPKFDHLKDMHQVLSAFADVILSTMPTRQDYAFFFGTSIAFLEAPAQVSETCYVRNVPPFSVSIIDIATCTTLFNSATVSTAAQSYERVDDVVVQDFDWSHQLEELPDSKNLTNWQTGIVEQSVLTLDDPSTQYAWYEGTFYEDADTSQLGLTIQGDRANAWVAFVDGEYRDNTYQTAHAEGPFNYTMDVGYITAGSKLLLLSESLGFNNLIGRWGAKSTAKVKGIVGDVFVGELKAPASWRSKSGLNGPASRNVTSNLGEERRPASWSIAHFNLTTPLDLLLDARGLGRGHFYVNGNDAGRFWNITRGYSLDVPTQRYYHIPRDWLQSGENRLVIFDALGGNSLLDNVRLLTSRIRPTDTPNMPDTIDSPKSCLV